MRYNCVLVAVSDMERSKSFYRDVLGMKITEDFGANVTLDGVVALQTLETWTGFFETEEVTLKSNSGELYFEEDDMDAFTKKLEDAGVRYVHKLKEHSWGQRVVRIYDPDGHIIEIGENMKMVVRRFVNAGLTVKETAIRMDVPEEYVLQCLD